MSVLLLSCVLVPLIVQGAGPGDKPDFSGQWVLVSPSDAGASVARELTVGQSIGRQTVRGDPMPPYFKTLTVERRFPTSARSESYEIGTRGGTVEVIGRDGRGSGPGGVPSQTRHSVMWDADTLVIKIGAYTGPTWDPGPYTEHEEVWALDQKGRLTIMMTERDSSAEPRVVHLTYRRR